MKTFQRISWLEKAYEYIDRLYEEAKIYIDEDVNDILPTQQAIDSAKHIMKLAKEAQEPEIAFSVNGEVVLSWQVSNGTLNAWCSADGHVDCHLNNDLITSSRFEETLNTMAA